MKAVPVEGQTRRRPGRSSEVFWSGQWVPAESLVDQMHVDEQIEALRAIASELDPRRQRTAIAALHKAAGTLESVYNLLPGLGMLSTEDTAEGRFAQEWYANLHDALGLED